MSIRWSLLANKCLLYISKCKDAIMDYATLVDAEVGSWCHSNAGGVRA